MRKIRLASEARKEKHAADMAAAVDYLNSKIQYWADKHAQYGGEVHLQTMLRFQKMLDVINGRDTGGAA